MTTSSGDQAAARRPEAIFGLNIFNPDDPRAPVFAFSYCSAVCRDKALPTIAAKVPYRYRGARSVDEDDKVFAHPLPVASCEYCGRSIDRRTKTP